MTVDKHLVVILVGRCKVGSLSVNGAGHVPEVPLCKMHIKNQGTWVCWFPLGEYEAP